MKLFFFRAGLLIWLCLPACGKKLEQLPKNPAQKAALSTARAPKPPHAEVVAFILTKCPYAASAMRALLELKSSMGDALNLKVGYLGAVDESGEPDKALGSQEIQSARIQSCVAATATEQRWISFLDCLYKEEKWQDVEQFWPQCALDAQIDQTRVSECLSSGEGDAIIAQSYGAAQNSGIVASPTLIIDGKPYFGERNVETLTRYICFYAGAEETRPESCSAFKPPQPIAATLLYDSRCVPADNCDVSGEIKLMQWIIPSITVTNVDFVSEDGRHLYDLIQKTGIGIRELPLLVLDETFADEHAMLAQIEEYLLPFGKGFLLVMGDGWDPLAEICDNTVDDNDDGLIDCDDPTCRDRPICRPEQTGVLDLFIMSGCPFARELLPAVDAALDHFGKKRGEIDFRLQFVGEVDQEELKSMHGKEEVEENLRMICAQKLYRKNYRFMEYVTCRARTFDSASWESCVPDWMSAKRLARCADGVEGRELLRNSFTLASNLGIKGSPSWLLNNRYEIEARTTDAITEQFCSHNERSACQKPVAMDPAQNSAHSDKKCR